MFDGFWRVYSNLNPDAKKIQNVLCAGREWVNDHVAFRTFNLEDFGISRLAEPFVSRGYSLKGRYRFQAKRLFACHYEHIDPLVPKIFISELFRSSNITPPKNMIEKEITLFWGGPVSPENIFFIHSSDYKSNDFISSNNDFTITREPKILYDIAKNKGPKEYIILSGISVWESGQLDSEMMKGDWDKKLNNYTPLFDNGKEMWNRIINSKDI